MKQETLAMTLRYKLGLTGTKLGCDRAECGACTVLVDDVPRYSCSVLTHSVRGKKIMTIEGLAAADGTLHPVQQGVVDEQGFQCAFCMPGFVMAAIGYLKTNPNPTRQELAHGVSGNLCRCQDYDKILTALMRGAELHAEGVTVADNKLDRTELHDARPRREGDRASRSTPKTSAPKACCSQAAAEPDAARARHAPRHERGAGDAGREGDPHRWTTCPARSLARRSARASRRAAQGERGLTMEPLYEGEPILAVAAVDELTAAEAIEKIQIEFEPLPFVVDPLVSLRPGSPNARTAGQRLGASAGDGDQRPAPVAQPPRVRHRRPAPRPRRQAPAAARLRHLRGAPAAAGQQPAPAAHRRRLRRRQLRRGSAAAAAGARPAVGGTRRPAAAARRLRRPEIRELKWTDEDFAAAGEGQMPMGKPTDEWSFGDVEEGFKQPTSSSTKRSSSQSTGHQPLETRTAMAYWQNGKLLSPRLDAEHRADGRARSRAGSASTPTDVVLISEYTGGGFGSKIPGAHLDGDSGAALEEGERAGA